MKRLLLIALVTLVGCASDNGGDVWGGYTEEEAKELMADPKFRQEVVQASPDPVTYERLMPTKQQLENEDLRKVTTLGQEAWEYKNEQANFCLYLWEDPETESFTAQPGPCAAD